MNLIKIQETFSTDKECRLYLEKLRWGKTITCTKCSSEKISRRKNQIGRYDCNTCNTTFSVITDTIFEGSRLPLHKWFLLIKIMLDAKDGISAKDIKRKLRVSYKTAWYSAMRVRCGMIDSENIGLYDIKENDEFYLGSNLQKKYSDEIISYALLKTTTDRGINAIINPIVDIANKNGKIVFKVVERFNTGIMLSMLNEFHKIQKNYHVPDKYNFDELVKIYTEKYYREKFINGINISKTVNDFWSIIKNSFRDNNNVISKKYLLYYMIQSQYLYNHRNYTGDLFKKYMKQILRKEKVKLMKGNKVLLMTPNYKVETSTTL